MKVFLWLLSAAAIILFCLTTYTIIRKLSGHSSSLIATSVLKGFQNDDQTVSGTRELKENCSDNIRAYSEVR